MFAKRMCAAIAAVTFVPAAALAASDGSVGSTSQGSSDISMTQGNLVRITNLADFAFGTWSGTGDLSGNDDVCVWSTTDLYNITASGDGTGSAFTLAGPGTETLAYSVQWTDSAGQTSGTALSTTVNQTGFTTAADSATCNGGTSPTASLIVSIAQADLEAAPAGAYAGTLTLLVAPE